MNLLSESLTIGLLFALIFGAFFFYLYSRVSYSEKRVGLIEKILLDIKDNLEQQPVHVLPPVPPSITFQQVAKPYPSISVNLPPPKVVTPQLKEITIDELQVPVVIDPISEEIYNDVMNEAHNEAHNEAQTEEREEVESQGQAKVTVNYESMTKDELLEIAKNKGLRVGNRPGRDKLIQLIRKSEGSLDEEVLI